MNNVLITGGAGFIGSNLVNFLVKKHKSWNFFILDKLTYSGNKNNIANALKSDKCFFIKGDIKDQKLIEELIAENNINIILNLAAESHVDRSIEDPLEFANTNVLGTLTLLNTVKKFWAHQSNHLFYHISTDEVYGSLGEKGLFKEDTRYDPRSPYSASKASSDHFVRAFGETYNLKYIISNCSNNYGPFQHPEKLIPLVISKILKQESIPVYGNGSNIRDWLYVMDHVTAIDKILNSGKHNVTYNIGGNNEVRNIDMVKKIIHFVDLRLGNQPGYSETLIRFVKDRKGHDYRYAIDNSKLKKELNWTPSVGIDKGLDMTIDWYLSNTEWIEEMIKK